MLSVVCPEIEVDGVRMTNMPREIERMFSLTSVPPTTVAMDQELRGVITAKNNNLVYLMPPEGERILRKVRVLTFLKLEELKCVWCVFDVGAIES